MFITRECDYAIRIIRELSNGEIKTVREICTMEHIPQQYAYKILKKLERAQLVNTYRGAYGGYRLGKEPAEITLYHILTAVADNLYVNECLQENYSCPRNTKHTPCTVHQECMRLDKLIMTTLQEKTMLDLLNHKDSYQESIGQDI